MLPQQGYKALYSIMSELKIEIVPALKDNYIYLLHDADSGNTAVIDPSVPEPVIKVLEERGWRLTHIFNNHHHWDHTGGNLVLKKKTGCSVTGFAGDAARIDGIDHQVKDGDVIKWSGFDIKIMHIPGHTTGAIAYYFKKQGAVFVGDTLFTMGCGRLFEGSPEMMFKSLSRIAKLPKKTQIFSGHEYAEGGARFALMMEPENKALQQRFKEVVHWLDLGEFIQPTTVKEELETNPFLRVRSKEIRKNLNMKKASDVEVFAEIRKIKDSY